MRLSCHLLAAVVGLSLLAPAPAAAQTQQGVFVDPNSPAGKEYAIPVEQARRDAAHGSNRQPVEAGDRSAPLFGEGVMPDHSGSSSGASGGNTGRGTGGGAKESDRTESLAKSLGPTSAIRPRNGLTAGAATADSSAGALAFAGGGVAVLLLGGMAGLVLRRRNHAR
jgi:LPXTG-motif cell wall-anchored protein